MFTGLVEDVGDVVELARAANGARLRVSSQLASGMKPGDSLAVNGVCLTVVATANGEVHADVGPETLRVTNLGGLERGALVNLERPLRADDRLGGHFVQGHVDAVGRLCQLRPDASFHWMTIEFPSELAPFIVLKGSIAVDGISLTVAGLSGGRFDVMIVPFTMEHTSLGRARVGDRVNLECDLLGKYVARAVELAGLAGVTREREAQS
jgi:riboflavin synthase alpha subunit